MQLEEDFARFLQQLCEEPSFFSEHIDFVLPRLKDLLMSVSVASKVDIEFQMLHRPLRMFGEVQSEIYLAHFARWLSVLFECAGREALIQTLEIVEHLLANLDECLLAKYLNRPLGKVLVGLLEDKHRSVGQPFRVRRIRLMKTIYQHLKATLEKSTFSNEEDALQRVYNVYCLITSIAQAFVGCQERQMKFHFPEENDFYLSWLTIDELSSIYGYLINTLVYLASSASPGFFSLAYEYILGTIVSTSVYLSGPARPAPSSVFLDFSL